MNWCEGQKLRHRCREQSYGHQGGKAVGGGGGGVMNWAIGIDMYTLMCIKLMTNKNLLYKNINKIKFNFFFKKERKHNDPKPMGCSKSSSKIEACSNTILPQETRKLSNKKT